MPDSLLITSRIKDYHALFVEDFASPLRKCVEQESFIIIDSIVHDLYGHKIDSVVPRERVLVIEACEENKSIIMTQKIVELLVDRQFRRNNHLVAVGGGVIQDITAFSASILYRGVEWTFFPTTLLAQADSCIGSKTSINLGDKKNLVGTFYPPSDIHIDVAFLETLPEADILSGIGEMLHYYYYAASPLFEKIIAEQKQLIADRHLLLPYIRESLGIKKSVIEIDEFDKGERNKFNYGHTFGHALESITDYTVKHGQAVTVGMDMANFISLHLGLMKQEVFDAAHALLIRNFPIYDWKRFDMERFIRFLSKDKKNIGSDLVLILAEQPGRVSRRQIRPDESFKNILRSYCADILQTAGNRVD